jgi:hypothetical protein
VQGTTPFRTSEPVCLGLILQPVALPPFLCTLSTFMLGRGSGGGPQPSPHVTGCPGCAGSSLWIFLAMAGVFAVFRSWHSCALGWLFAFPPPLVGAELGHKRGSHSFVSTFVKQLT